MSGQSFVICYFLRPEGVLSLKLQASGFCWGSRNLVGRSEARSQGQMCEDHRPCHRIPALPMRALVKTAGSIGLEVQK